MKQIITKPIDFKDIYLEYLPDMELDDDNIYNLKSIIFNKLNETDRRILILYSETQSLRKVAAILNLSLGLVHNQIKIIRNKICSILNYYQSL